MQNSLSRFGDLKIPVTVWVDAAGRLRKLDLTIDLDGSSGDKLRHSTDGVDPKIEVTVELYDFGVPVTVVAPPGAISRGRSPSQDRDRAVGSAQRAHRGEDARTPTTRRTAPTLRLLKQIEPSLDWGGKLTVVGRPTRRRTGSGRVPVGAVGVRHDVRDRRRGLRPPCRHVLRPGRGARRSLNDATVAAFDASWCDAGSRSGDDRRRVRSSPWNRVISVGRLGCSAPVLPGRSRAGRARSGRGETRARRVRRARGRRSSGARAGDARPQGRPRCDRARARPRTAAALPERTARGAARAGVLVRLAHRAVGVRRDRGRRAGAARTRGRRRPATSSRRGSRCGAIASSTTARTACIRGCR